MALIKCDECGKEYSDKASSCPNCGNPTGANGSQPQPQIIIQAAQSVPQKEKKKGGCMRLVVGAFCLFIILGVIGSLTKDEKQQPSASSSTTTSTTTASSSAPPVQIESLKPESQKKFEEIVAAHLQQYKDAQNELQESTARKNRGKSLGSLGMGYSVKDWVGTISSMVTTTEGDAGIDISVNKSITISTWNNSLSDIADGTLIKSESPLYQKIINLKKGQKVKFSGKLVKSDGMDFYKETSLTIDGSMRSPDFLIIFTDISPLQ